MQFSVLTTLFLAGSAAANVMLENRQVPASCTANNCARAVLGSNVKDPSAPARTSACLSFQMTTVATKVNGSPASTITPTSVPAFASFCSSAGSFKSACACKFPPTTTTVPAEDKCNADNCARAVYGTRSSDPDLAMRLASCSAYTVTAFGSEATQYPQAPAFASACVPDNRFASACSCAGVAVATTTITGSD